MLGDGASRTHGVTVSCLHAAMLPSGHQQKDSRRTRTGHWEEKKRTTRGEEEDTKKNTKDKKRTTGGQGPETGWQRGQAAHPKKDKKRTTGGQRPDTAFTGAVRDCGQLLFS